MTRVFLLGALLSGCSAIVSPDESELDPAITGTDAGRTDGFVPGTDGGPRDTGTTDTGFVCTGGCDDGVACTTDTCAAAETCENTPSDALCGAGERCNPASGCVPRVCTSHTDCNDGLPCNGEETCDPTAEGADSETGCLPGGPPACDDGFTCTTDACDNGAGGCVSTPNDAACDDTIDCSVDSCNPASATDATGCIHVENDALCDTGFCTTGGACSIAAGGCEGGTMRDCRDFNPCTADSCDETTMMCVNVGRDQDGDGAAAARVGDTTCAGGTDCDDFDPTRRPGATEYCNGRDDDCDGSTDEGCTPINDDCGDAEQLVLDAAGNATRTGSFGIYTADYGTICGESGGRDAVYYVDITGTSDVTIHTIGSTADTVLAVGTECSSSGFRLWCNDDVNRGVDQDSRIWVHRISPSAGSTTVRLYILLDSFNASVTGAWSLSVSVRPARADTCATPLDITGGGSIYGFIGIGAGIGGQRGSCQGIADTSPEAIATFTGAPSGNYRFDVYSPSFDPDLYVRSAPCASGTEIDCVAGDGGSSSGIFYTAMSGSITAGSTYYLFVDGATASGRYLATYDP